MQANIPNPQDDPSIRFNNDLFLAASAIKRYSRNIAQTLPSKDVEALAKTEREVIEARKALAKAQRDNSYIASNIFQHLI